jgi:NAD(P)-dependent dehydrogenase (short-subunit alcohol dehydrogenase family)
MPTDIAGKAIIVVGGASGLGLATVKLLAETGAKLAVLDIDRSSLERCMDQLGSRGRTAHAICGNIVPKAEAAGLVRQAAAKLGQLDGLVNCAGVYPRKPILDITDDDWDFDWKINVRGTYNTMVAAVALMRGQPPAGKVRGRIVNVSSVDAFKAHPQNAHYAATKAAVVSLTRSFALEFAPDQILVNAIAPAGIATEKAKTSGFLAELASHTPLGRNAELDDITSWISFMLSDGNNYMTGETVIVSGGYIFA